MPAYKDEKKNTWYVMFYYKDWQGKSIKKKKCGFKTKKEALAYENQYKDSAEVKMNITLEAFVKIYFEDKKNELKERTIKNKKYMMEQYIIPYFGNQMMNEITASQIIQWQNEMQTKGFSEAYLRMIQNQLTSLFTHASRIYDLQNNPCKKVKRMGNFDNRSLNFWTLEEYQKFIQTIEVGTKYYVIFEILFWTGCRVGELLALTKQDINFEKIKLVLQKLIIEQENKILLQNQRQSNLFV